MTVPVTDLQRSAAWYRALRELDLIREFVEQGILRGASLADGLDGTHPDVPDPGGTIIRFLSSFSADGPVFAGAEFHADGTVTFYDKPRPTAT